MGASNTGGTVKVTNFRQIYCRNRARLGIMHLMWDC